MSIKRNCFWRGLLICAVTVGCFAFSARAMGLDAVHLKELEHRSLAEFAMTTPDDRNATRASGSINVVISANSTSLKSTGISLDAGETITFDCTYTPVSASVDFGVIAPDGQFYYFNVTGGSITKTILIEERGTYTMAIVNNSSYSINVTGTVRY